MTAQEYIAELSRLLYSLTDQEREEAVAFYRESIADRIDDGQTEEEAVASMVSPAEAACAILSNQTEASASMAQETDEIEAELPEQPRELVQPPSFWMRLRHGQLTPLEWVGVILSSVIWLPLVIATFGIALGIAVVLFALYLCAWVLIGCVWIIGAALVVAAPANTVFILLGLQIGNIPFELVNAGYSLVAFGSGMWVLRGALALTKLFMRAHKMVACKIEHTPYVPEASAPSATRSGMTTFFTICLILIGAGFASVLAGYVLSGFDWHVFTTSFNKDGSVVIGGMKVDHPERFLFAHLFPAER